MSAATSIFNTTASYPIRFDEPKAKDDRKARWHSVRYNHLPRSKSGRDFTGKLKAGSKGGEAVLSLRDGEDAYSYRGQSREEKGSYVLVLKGEGDEKEMVLERVNGAWAFNLTGEPGQQDAGKLAQVYSSIHLDEEVQKETSTQSKVVANDDFGEPDDTNPFDYRHFLKAQAQAPLPSAARAPGSGFNTPQSTASPRPTTKPAAAAAARRQPEPAQKKRKTATSAAKPAPSTNNKSTTATQKKRTETSISASRKQPQPQEVPSLKLDRKASLLPNANQASDEANNNDDDDDGELILENDAPTSKAPPRHTSAMALALGGQLGTGTSSGRTPMSLNSAVSSPGARLNSASPAPGGGEEREEYEFDFGNDDDDGDDGNDDDGDDRDAAGDDDDDADVEDLELPSPAAGRGFSGQARGVGGGGGGGGSGEVEGEGEEEDDLEKQMMMAMAEEAPAVTVGGGVEDESEESEEE